MHLYCRTRLIILSQQKRVANLHCHPVQEHFLTDLTVNFWRTIECARKEVTHLKLTRRRRKSERRTEQVESPPASVLKDYYYSQL